MATVEVVENANIIQYPWNLYYRGIWWCSFWFSRQGFRIQDGASGMVGVEGVGDSSVAWSPWGSCCKGFWWCFLCSSSIPCKLLLLTSRNKEYSHPIDIICNKKYPQYTQNLFVLPWWQKTNTILLKIMVFYQLLLMCSGIFFLHMDRRYSLSFIIRAYWLYFVVNVHYYSGDIKKSETGNSRAMLLVSPRHHQASFYSQIFKFEKSIIGALVVRISWMLNNICIFDHLMTAMLDPPFWVLDFWLQNWRKHRQQPLYTKFYKNRANSFWNMSEEHVYMLPGVKGLKNYY